MLHFSLPPGYPSAAAAVHASSPQFGRGEVDALSQQLQIEADAAAGKVRFV